MTCFEREHFLNPFKDPDRHDLWEMLVRRDIEGFLSQDWSVVAANFHEPGFIGINARFNPNPDAWEPTYATLDAYREAWLAQSREFAASRFRENPRERLYAAMELAAIKFSGDAAVAHKKFDGSILKEDGACLELRWQSLFFCRKQYGCWKITGFVGYLPNPMHPRSVP